MELLECVLDDLEKAAALGGDRSRAHSGHRARVVRVRAAHHFDLLRTLVFTKSEVEKAADTGESWPRQPVCKKTG